MKFRILSSAVVFMLSVVASVSAHTSVYDIVLSGPNESPPNASPGTGVGTVTVDFDLVTMRVQADFSGLLGTVSAAHIHCCTAIAGTGLAGVATPTPTFPGFPSGVTFGSYDRTFDLTQASSYNGAFVTANGGTVSGALNALTAGFDAGKAYLNIHSSTFGGGEIRGFLQLVPEPTCGSMLLVGLVSATGFRRRR